MLGGMEPGSAGYGLYAGKGWSTCARASVNPARGTLRIPSTVAKAAFTSVLVSRRIGVPSPARTWRSWLISGTHCHGLNFERFQLNFCISLRYRTRSLACSRNVSLLGRRLQILVNLIAGYRSVLHKSFFCKVL